MKCFIPAVLLLFVNAAQAQYYTDDELGCYAHGGRFSGFAETSFQEEQERAIAEQPNYSPAAMQQLQLIVTRDVLKRRGPKGWRGAEAVKPGDKLFRAEGMVIRAVSHWGDEIVLQFDDGSAVAITPADFKEHVPSPQERENARHEAKPKKGR